MKIISNLIEAHLFKETANGLEFLLLKRNNNQIYAGIWQMVSGKIKDGEKATETVLREIQEETQLKPLKLWVIPRINSFYSDSDDSICLVPVFAALVSQNSNVVISDEHSEHKWVNALEAKKMLAWDGQRKAVDLIEEYFLNEMSFLNFVEVKIK